MSTPTITAPTSGLLRLLGERRSAVLHALAPFSGIGLAFMGASPPTPVQALQAVLGVLGVLGTYRATPHWLKACVPFLTAVLVALPPYLQGGWHDLTWRALAPSVAHVLWGSLVAVLPNTKAAPAPVTADGAHVVTSLPATTDSAASTPAAAPVATPGAEAYTSAPTAAPVAAPGAEAYTSAPTAAPAPWVAPPVAASTPAATVPAPDGYGHVPAPAAATPSASVEADPASPVPGESGGRDDDAEPGELQPAEPGSDPAEPAADEPTAAAAAPMPTQRSAADVNPPTLTDLRVLPSDNAGEVDQPLLSQAADYRVADAGAQVAP